MSVEESHSESEVYYPEEEEQAKTEQNNLTKVTVVTLAHLGLR